jgi:hypothetical protein
LPGYLSAFALSKRHRVRLNNTNLFKRVHSLVTDYAFILCADKHARESTSLLALHFEKRERVEREWTLNFCALQHQPNSTGARCPLQTFCPFDFSGLADLDAPDII